MKFKYYLVHQVPVFIFSEYMLLTNIIKVRMFIDVVHLNRQVLSFASRIGEFSIDQFNEIDLVRTPSDVFQKNHVKVSVHFVTLLN